VVAIVRIRSGGDRWLSFGPAIEVAPTTNVFDANNQINTTGYDAKGKQTQSGESVFQYDAENRLISTTCWGRHTAPYHALGCPGWRYYRSMAKRIMVAVVGAGIGSLAGLLVSFLGAGNPALIVGAIVGAAIPLLVLGSPGH
jgi:hypothetical protein